MEWKWKRAVSAIALLMTLGQAPCVGGDHRGLVRHTAVHPFDGKCSLIEAIVNANKNARTHLGL
jgi:hypothetical protein